MTRRAAEHAGLRVTGVLGVLLRAKNEGQIERVRPEVEALRTRARFFVSARCWRSRENRTDRLRAVDRHLPQVELLHLIAQGVAGDAEEAGGLGLVAAGFSRAGASSMRSLSSSDRPSVGTTSGAWPAKRGMVMAWG